MKFINPYHIRMLKSTHSEAFIYKIIYTILYKKEATATMFTFNNTFNMFMLKTIHLKHHENVKNQSFSCKKLTSIKQPYFIYIFMSKNNLSKHYENVKNFMSFCQNLYSFIHVYVKKHYIGSSMKMYKEMMSYDIRYPVFVYRKT